MSDPSPINSLNFKRFNLNLQAKQIKLVKLLRGVEKKDHQSSRRSPSQTNKHVMTKTYAIQILHIK